MTARYTVSVLFSEPKIPQRARPPAGAGDHPRFSALSEPKIPQQDDVSFEYVLDPRFSALQPPENSSTARGGNSNGHHSIVSVLFSEPKIPQPDPRTCVHPYSQPQRSRFVIPEPSWCVAMTPVY